MRCVSRLIVLSMLFFSVALFAQQPTPTGKMGPGPSADQANEVFAGYLHQPTDWGTVTEHGFEVNLTHFWGERWGGVADFDWAKSTDPLDTTSWAGRLGPRFNLLKRHRKVVPYVDALFGGARLRATVAPNLNGYWHGFTWAVGGGAEVNLNRHWGARFQGDWTGLPYGNHNSSQWQRLAFGVTYRF